MSNSDKTITDYIQLKQQTAEMVTLEKMERRALAEAAGLEPNKSLKKENFGSFELKAKFRQNFKVSKEVLDENMEFMLEKGYIDSDTPLIRFKPEVVEGRYNKLSEEDLKGLEEIILVSLSDLPELSLARKK